MKIWIDSYVDITNEIEDISDIELERIKEIANDHDEIFDGEFDHILVKIEKNDHINFLQLDGSANWKITGPFVSIMNNIGSLKVSGKSVEINSLGLSHLDLKSESIVINKCNANSMHIENIVQRNIDINSIFDTTLTDTIDNSVIDFISYTAGGCELQVTDVAVKDSFVISGIINELMFLSSNITNFVSNDVLIKSISLVRSKIENVYSLKEKEILKVDNDEDSLMLLAKSSKSDNDSIEYVKFCIKYNKCVARNSDDKILQLGFKFMDLVSGFGYRPSRVLWFSTIIISFYTVIYSIIDCIEYLHKYGWKSYTGIFSLAYEGFFNNLYLSLMAFTTTGFGDVSPTCIAEKILTGTQSLIGISIMAIFIYSLTKRFSVFTI